MNPRLKLFLPLVVFVLLAGIMWRGLQLDPSHLPSALIGKPLPEFKLAHLESKDETILSRKDLVNGKPFLLNVWGTWCALCIHEHPFLLKLADQGVRIIGVSYNDENQAALDWLDRYKSPYELNIVDSEGTLGLDLGVYGAPETYVVDGEGTILYRHAGVLDKKVWQTHMAHLMIQ